MSTVGAVPCQAGAPMVNARQMDGVTTSQSLHSRHRCGYGSTGRIRQVSMRRCGWRSQPNARAISTSTGADGRRCRTVPDPQPGDRRGDRHRGGRRRERHGPGHRRRATAFDTGEWATDTALRVRCIRQLQDAMRAHIDEPVRSPWLRRRARMLTAAAQWRARSPTSASPPTPLRPTRGAPISVLPKPDGHPTRRTLVREAVGVVGAITPWNFPTRSTSPRSGRPGAATLSC